MGLLDDAIREHLELKRRSGADPGEIAHQERAALEPVLPEQGPDADVQAGVDAHPDALAGDAPVGEPFADPPAGDASAPDVADDAPGEARAAVPEALPDGASQHGDVSALGQETAELDMQTVLGGGDHGDGGMQADGAAPGDGGRHAAADDSMDWDFPGGSDERRQHAPDEVPGQERMSFE